MPEFLCHIAVIGVGLGGLAAGIGILQAGHRVSIIERAPALAEVFYRSQGREATFLQANQGLLTNWLCRSALESRFLPTQPGS